MSSAKRTMIFSAGADDKFANSIRHVGLAVGSLRSEAFVIVIVAANDDVGAGVVERLPEWFERKVVAVFAAGAEERLVKIREFAGSRMRGEIGAKPFFLARTDFAATNF